MHIFKCHSVQVKSQSQSQRQMISGRQVSFTAIWRTQRPLYSSRCVSSRCWREACRIWVWL